MAKVLVIVSSSFPNAADGTEAAGSFVADLVDELSRYVHVRVVAPGACNEIQQVNPNLRIYRFTAPLKPLSTLRPYALNDLWQILKVLRAGGAATQSAVNAGDVVHILALWALPCGYWARKVSRLSAVPYSVWTLGSDIWSLGRIPIIRQVLACVLRDSFHCYSDGYRLRDDTQKIAGRDVGFLPSTRNIQPDREKALSVAPPYRLVFIGRWHINKGPDLLVRALSLLDENTWRKIASVEIYGGGPLRLVLETAVADLDLRKRPVILAGFLDKWAARDVLHRTDYLLIPSRIESIPVVFSDAMKLGCPVVANPVGDLAVLVGEGPVGILATAVDAEAYAEAIRIAVQSSPAEYERALKAMASRFSLEDVLVPLLMKELDLNRAQSHG